MRSALFALGLSITALGCGGSEPTGTASELEAGERPDEPGSTRASREEARPVTDETGDTRPTPTPPAADRPLFVAHPIDAAEGGDGSGETVAATEPIAFDLDARRFPPQAADPVLHVGELRFERYVHPRPGVLRFVAADRASLPEGAEVWVQYGDDESTRVVISDALVLP